jgi:MacB-like periplasmic core domain
MADTGAECFAHRSERHPERKRLAFGRWIPPEQGPLAAGDHRDDPGVCAAGGGGVDGYFDVFRIPLSQGGLFTDRDGASAPRVVVVNEGLAKQYWPAGGALGQRISIGKGVGPEFDEPPRELIGIVGDVRNQGLNSKPDPIMYIPVAS